MQGVFSLFADFFLNEKNTRKCVIVRAKSTIYIGNASQTAKTVFGTIFGCI
jgi:hypothetical protein